MEKMAIGMLVYNRPIHTGLALSFALNNKHDLTDMHVFYSIHRTAVPPSKALDGMLKSLDDAGIITLHYLNENVKQTCGGNVDTLLITLTGFARYKCFIKIDDDVLIGAGIDELMQDMLFKLERDEVYMLMGQPVADHMRMPKPFVWETECRGYRVVQRAHRACPMETCTAVNPKLFTKIKGASYVPSCEDDKGTFMGLTRKLTAAGYKSGLILTPHISMQHIGLTSTIENGAARGWAPARTWEPPHDIVEVSGFDFVQWEGSHKAGKQKEVALGFIEQLSQFEGKETILDYLNRYKPNESDVPLPAVRTATPMPAPVRRAIPVPPTAVRKPVVTRKIVVKPQQAVRR